MARKKSWVSGADNVLNWFEANAKEPYFSVWKGREILFSNNENDFEAAKDKLHSNIVAGEQNNVTEDLQLRLHYKPAKGYINNKSEYHSSLFFTPTEVETMHPATMYYQNNNNNNAILEKLNGIESRISAIETDEDPEEEEEEEKPKGINGIIDTLLQNEQIQMAMINAATSFIGKFMPQNKPMGIAGIPEEQDEKIIGAIAILKQHNANLGDDLMKLADMAQNNNGQFNFLISMLRK